MMTLAAKTEVNINAFSNASIMLGGTPSYGMYDLKTDLISFYSWSEKIKRLKAGYEYEEDAIYDIAYILAPNHEEAFINGFI